MTATEPSAQPARSAISYRSAKGSRAALVLVGIISTLLLLWPSIFNGQPFFYSDTTTYIRGAAAGLERLFGVTSAWSPVPADTNVSSAGGLMSEPSRVQSVANGQRRMPDAILAGRSVYYGALAYAGYAAGGYWLTVLVQSAAVVLAISFLFQAFGVLRPANVILTVLLLCLTPAALHVSFLMPDIFTGLSILSCTMLLYGPPRQRRGNSVFWFSLLAYALLTHTFNVLLCGGMLLIAAMLYPIPRYRPSSGGLILTVSALVLAFAGEAAFSAGVRLFLGQTPVRPPFLMARLIGDGTGEQYLRTHCDHSTLTVCRYADRLPMHFDTFLWSGDPQHGVFSIAAPDTKRALEREQLQFAIAVLRDQPWAQLAASSRNFYDQLVTFGAREFAVWEPEKEAFVARLPLDSQSVMRRSRYFQNKMPINALTHLAQVVILVCVLYLTLLISYLLLRRQVSTVSTLRIVPLVLIGVVVNAGLSGCLSEPLDRFQARVIWLIPAIALLSVFELMKPMSQASNSRVLC